MARERVGKLTRVDEFLPYTFDSSFAVLPASCQNPAVHNLSSGQGPLYTRQV